MTQTLIGRQPILNREGQVHAYELLFRPSEVGTASQFDGNRATANVVVNALTEIGLEQVVGPHCAYINFTDDLLLSDTVLLLPKERVVIEILEDASISDELISAVSALAKQGYVFALDDFIYAAKWEPLIEIASVIKIDVLALGREEIKEHVDRLKGRRVKLLAEKVETFEQHASLLELGFDYFQGYYYAKPDIVARDRIPDNHLAVLRLLAALNSRAITTEEIEHLVSEDVALSYRLMRYLNSAFFALPKKIDSIRRAVVYFGIDMLRQWTTLLVMASVSGKPQILMQNALVRARMCEGLAKIRHLPDSDSYFTVGLFSVLDSLMDVPMTSIVDSLPLNDAMAAALLNRAGEQGAALNCVCAYEMCLWAEVEFADLSQKQIGKIYLESISWALDASSGL
ncbi:MAG: EAL and modified HD-GYP domain-containing signal transduction protein [Gammaproteobacteria bacterium]